MSKTAFESLRVYRLAEDLAEAVWNVAGGWDSFARDTVGKQIVSEVNRPEDFAPGNGRLTTDYGLLTTDY